MKRTSNTADRGWRLDEELDRLAERAGRMLLKAYLPERSRELLCRAVSVLFLFVLPVIALELLRYLAGYPSFGLDAWQYGLFVLAFAAACVAGWLRRDYLRQRFARGKTLGLFDSQLGLANRLVTADEFARKSERSAFMVAAIDDAAEPAERARRSSLQPIGVDKHWPLSRWSLLSVPGALALLVLTVWLGGLERAGADAELPGGMRQSDANSPDLAVVARLTDESADKEAWAESEELAQPGEVGADGQDAASGETLESQTGTVAGSRGGQPALQEKSEAAANSESGGMPSGAGSQAQAASASGQHSAGEDSAALPRDQQGSPSGSNRQKQAASAHEEAARKAAGGGPSGESGDTDNQGNAGRSGSDMPSESNGGQAQQQAAAATEDSAQVTAADQSASEQSGSDGRSESGERGDSDTDAEGGDRRTQSEQGQQDAGNDQSGDRRSAEDSNQNGGQPQATSAEEQEQPNSQSEGGQPGSQSNSAGGRQSGDGEEGRGASKDAIKKNRGAATAMLALPVGDRLIGSRGQGPEQRRQEQTAPEEQQWAPVATDARAERSDRIGTLQHASVSGWSRDLVKGYFDRLRGEVPGDGTNASTTDIDNGQGEQE